jgi:hypothetical protein
LSRLRPALYTTSLLHRHYFHFAMSLRSDREHRWVPPFLVQKIMSATTFQRFSAGLKSLETCERSVVVPRGVMFARR